MSNAIPDPRELTAEWFASILRGASGKAGLVETASVTPVEPQGRASRTFRARLTGEGVPGSLIVKMARTEPSYLERRLNFGTYRLEVDFFQRLAPSLGSLVPRCYYAAADDTDGRFLLVLEELGSGGEKGSAEQTADEGVGAIARIHARYDGDESVTELFLRCALPGMFDQRRIGPAEKSILESLLGEKLEAGQLPDLVVAAARTQIGHFERLAESLHAQRMTLVHGDFHLSQVMRRPDGGGGACVIDWQTPMFGNGALDLQRLVFSRDLSPTDRRAFEQNVLSEYHRSVQSCGIEDYTMDQLERDYALACHHTLMRALMPAEERATGSDGRVHAAMEMLDAAIADLKYVELIESL